MIPPVESEAYFLVIRLLTLYVNIFCYVFITGVIDDVTIGLYGAIWSACEAGVAVVVGLSCDHLRA